MRRSSTPLDVFVLIGSFDFWLELEAYLSFIFAHGVGEMCTRACDHRLSSSTSTQKSTSLLSVWLSGSEVLNSSKSTN